MTIERKVGMGIAGQPSGGAPDVADVFSVDVWDNEGSSATITSGLDSTDSDVMIWAKQRDGTGDHYLADTVRGITKYMRSNSANMESTNSEVFASTSSTGYAVGSILGGSTQSYVGWQFKKKEKFFDIVTWNGNSTAGRQISHSLNSPVGMIIVKRTNANGQGWAVYHRSANYNFRTGYYNTYNAGKSVYNLHGTGGPNSGASSWNNTDATSDHFTVGNGANVNQTGGTYVAYLFADNSTEDAEKQMIKCNYYWGNANANGPIVELGWEPQWLLIRPSSTNNWLIYDNIRGVPRANSEYNSGKSQELWPNLNSAENWDGNNANKIEFNSTGFQIKSASATHNKTSDSKGHLFVAIRAPLMQEPKAATDVFSVDAAGSGVAPSFESGFPVDFAIYRNVSSVVGNNLGTRMLGTGELFTNNNAAIAGSGAVKWDFSNGFFNSTSRSASYYAWMWKRAKGYMDLVAFSGSGSAKNVAHSLGVAPEMMWVKKRSGQEGWAVYHKLNGGTHFARLESNASYIANNGLWNNTDTTASVFRVGTDTEVNQSGQTYIAYLFASLAGISKVGSFSGSTGNVVNVECGFAPRLVLIKKSNGTGNWLLFDTVRGIVSGNDAKIQLDLTDPQNSATDYIDPYSTGFSLSLDTEINENGKSFIFYAIA